MPIGRKPVWLEVEIPRVFCKTCNCVRQIDTKIAKPRKGYTRNFERYVITLSKMMTLKDIALLLGISWDTVKDIVKENLKKRFLHISLKDVRHLAIDEISIRKEHKYVTLVMDLERGNIIYVGDGKGAEALKPFWIQLDKNSKNIKSVSTDLGPAYIAAVIDNLPGVPLVFDHFHMVKLMNDTLSEIRRGLYHEVKDIMQKKVIKGTRWILLKNPENLSATHNEYGRLQEALKLNEPLATAYYMKEELRQFWKQPSRESAEIAIKTWVKQAEASGIGPLIKMGRTVAVHKFGILNWYDHPISSARMEGTNNKIKVLKRAAYGYRDMEFFKLRLLAIHEAKYAFTG